MSIKKVLEEELKRIKLSEEEIEKLKRIAEKFISLLSQKGLTAFVGGSLAKNTILRNDNFQDIDIFVVFESTEKLLKLEGILNKVNLPGKLEKVHGSRDYFRIRLENNIVLEIIPVLKNGGPEKAENVTDVSLLHVNYVAGEIKKNLKISDQIILAKAFARANGVYGAESYIKGFSGYSLEVLIIYFGSFEKLLKSLGKKKAIDPAKHFINEREALHEINASKLSGPLLLVDPTYKYRNVTAGLGYESYEKFLKVADSFLKKPDLDFFNKKKADISKLKKIAKLKKARFIEIDLTTSRDSGNIAGTKMKKFFDFFISELNRKQQKILEKQFEYSGEGHKAKGYLIIKEKKEIKIRGPLAEVDFAVAKFRKAKGKTAFKRGKYWWYKENINILDVFKNAKRIEDEMGAGGNIVEII